jgi:hypothetical protein
LETWEWDGVSWTQRMVVGPPYGGALAYDAARGVTVLVGCEYKASTLETWEWDGTTWTQRMVTGPPGRYGHVVAYHAGREVIVLFGGANAECFPCPLSDTWEWDGTSWTRVTIDGPYRRKAHAMAYNESAGAIVLFGGSFGYGRELSDTWELGLRCRADFNGDGSLNSQDSFDFLGAFFENTPDADFNADAVVNSQDFFDFLTAFFVGC